MLFFPRWPFLNGVTPLDAAVAEIDTADVRELRKVVIAGDAFASNASIVETQALLRSKLSARIDKDPGCLVS